MNRPITQSDVEEVLRDFDDLIDRIGDEKADRVSTQTDDGRPVIGRQVQHGQQEYHVIGVAGQESVNIQYGYNAAQDLAISKAVTDGGQQVAAGQGVNIGPQQVQSAMDELRDAVDEDELVDIRIGVTDRLTGPGLVTQLEADDTFVYGFTVSRALYPYDRTVEIQEFADTVQTVVSHGWNAREFLVHKYDLEDLLGDDSDSGLRGFQ